VPVGTCGFVGYYSCRPERPSPSGAIGRFRSRDAIERRPFGKFPLFFGPNFIVPSNVSAPKELKNAGLKATVPRLKIISIFEASKVRHLTAEDVYRKLLDEGPDIGLATVYRVLTQFEQAGLLVRHHFDSGKAVFELNEGHHHDHIVCIRCGRVEEFYDAAIEKRQHAVARERGFEISGHALYLYADCVKPRCPYRKSSRGDEPR
jgi:Fur family ferric uptake transcriptional regulator